MLILALLTLLSHGCGDGRTPGLRFWRMGRSQQDAASLPPSNQ
jgi:hypothetical protein